MGKVKCYLLVAPVERKYVLDPRQYRELQRRAEMRLQRVLYTIIWKELDFII